MNVVGQGFAEAVKFDNDVMGVAQLVMALLSEPSAVASVLVENGITYDRVAEIFGERHMTMRPDGSIDESRRYPPGSASMNPDAQQTLGRAEGLAIARGLAQPQPEEWLVAMLYSPDGSGFAAVVNFLGTSRSALADSMRRAGMSVPDVELPPHTKPVIHRS